METYKEYLGFDYSTPGGLYLFELKKKKPIQQKVLDVLLLCPSENEYGCSHDTITGWYLQCMFTFALDGKVWFLSNPNYYF